MLFTRWFHLKEELKHLGTENPHIVNHIWLKKPFIPCSEFLHVFYHFLNNLHVFYHFLNNLHVIKQRILMGCECVMSGNVSKLSI